ncbi:MAG: hypothetical protein CMI12_13860 [Oceanospirillum sp.]|nr:hypothetical protein [Oceanospirillum sp.]
MSQLCVEFSLLEPEVVVTGRWQHTELDLLDTQTGKRRLYSIDSTIKTNTLPALREMILNHMGVVLCPGFLVQADIRAERLVQVLPEVHGRAWHFYFLHQYMGDKPIHISRFYQLIYYHFNRVAQLGSV